jgi:hypothetical protein
LANRIVDYYFDNSEGNVWASAMGLKQELMAVIEKYFVGKPLK